MVNPHSGLTVITLLSTSLYSANQKTVSNNALFCLDNITVNPHSGLTVITLLSTSLYSANQNTVSYNYFILMGQY